MSGNKTNLRESKNRFVDLHKNLFVFLFWNEKIETAKQTRRHVCSTTNDYANSIRWWQSLAWSYCLVMKYEITVKNALTKLNHSPWIVLDQSLLIFILISLTVNLYHISTLQDLFVYYLEAIPLTMNSSTLQTVILFFYFKKTHEPTKWLWNVKSYHAVDDGIDLHSTNAKKTTKSCC